MKTRSMRPSDQPLNHARFTLQPRQWYAMKCNFLAADLDHGTGRAARG